VFALPELAPEQGTTARHSPLYYARIPSLIRGAPTPGIVGPPRYVWDFSPTAPFPMASVMFRTSLPNDDAKSEIIAYLRTQGFENHARGRMRRISTSQYAYVAAENGFISIGLLDDVGTGDTRSTEYRALGTETPHPSPEVAPEP
jgi:hypothetical protein